MDVTIIGHGSLMSGLGLSSSGTFQVKEVGIIALTNCRRGFAKLSRYGDRFATDLEIACSPLEGRIVTPGSLSNGEIEGLALTVPLDDAYRLSQREGYSPAALQQLAELAGAQGLGLAAFLWQLHVEAEHDVVQYRRQLFTLTGVTSPHYIPHPVSLGAAGYALVFLAPGFEGTGADEIISVRQQTGMRAIMSTVETWRRKPNEDQLAYFLACLLGGVHGICLHDLLSTISQEPELTTPLRSRLGQLVQEERAYFLAATGLLSEQYHRSFGDPEVALERSRLKHFLHGDENKA